MDLDNYRADSRLDSLPASKRLPKHKGREWFLKGPIPGAWLTRAAKLPGKALHVALAAWHLAGLSRRSTVSLSRQVAERFGASRYAVNAGLAKLESAGLVTVERKPGCSPVVTIIERSETK